MPEERTDLDIAVERLTAWLREYGPSKPQVFVGDVTIVLMAARESRRSKSTCCWEWNTAHALWLTGCGEEHEFDLKQSELEGTGFKFCPYCPGRIIEESSG